MFNHLPHLHKSSLLNDRSARCEQKTFTQVGDKVLLSCRGSNFIVTVDDSFSGSIVVKKEFRRGSMPSKFVTFKTITAPTSEPEWLPCSDDNSSHAFMVVECAALASGTPVVTLAEM